MRLIVVGMLAGSLAAWSGAAAAQSAASTLFGHTCTATFPHSIVKHMFVTKDGASVVHVWYKVPNGANVFVSSGVAPVTINTDGSMHFASGHYQITVVPDGKGKGEVTMTGMGSRSSTASYEECTPSS